MRVKVESVAPLPHVKAWFSAHALPTVADLKTALCADLAPLSHEHVRPQDVLLLLDDFELLDASPIDVVRDGDLVVIKKRPTPTKRKAPQDTASPARKRTKVDDGRAVSRAPQTTAKRPVSAKPQPQVASDSSSESSSDSDDSSDSSDLDSNTDASNDSDASSTSGSSESSTSSASSSNSSSSAPSVKASRPKTGRALAASAKNPEAAKLNAPPVPPGLGKPTTHSRNLRRRRKKMYERLALTAEPASVNDIPLGTRARTVEPAVASASATPQPQAEGERHTAGEAPAFMMASLQNKNKRRGFKNALTQGVPPKIVFPDAALPPPQQRREGMDVDPDPDARVVEAALQLPPTPTPRPRLVPPSEKQERGLLPPNVFVTSVDVEEGMWPAKNRGGKKNKKNKGKSKKQATEEVRDYEQEEADAFVLPYDDVPVEEAPAVSGGEGTAAAATGSTEHAVVAAQWDTLRKIADKTQVQAGATVAWKALGINFATLTPEMLLHVGRVVKADENLVVEPFAEPGVEEVSFGGAVVSEEGGAVEETFEWADVLQGDWRLVSAR